MTNRVGMAQDSPPPLTPAPPAIAFPDFGATFADFYFQQGNPTPHFAISVPIDSLVAKYMEYVVGKGDADIGQLGFGTDVEGRILELVQNPKSWIVLDATTTKEDHDSLRAATRLPLEKESIIVDKAKKNVVIVLPGSVTDKPRELYVSRLFYIAFQPTPNDPKTAAKGLIGFLYQGKDDKPQKIGPKGQVTFTGKSTGLTRKATMLNHIWVKDPTTSVIKKSMDTEDAVRLDLDYLSTNSRRYRFLDRFANSNPAFSTEELKTKLSDHELDQSAFMSYTVSTISNNCFKIPGAVTDGYMQVKSDQAFHLVTVLFGAGYRLFDYRGGDVAKSYASNTDVAKKPYFEASMEVGRFIPKRLLFVDDLRGDISRWIIRPRFMASMPLIDGPNLQVYGNLTAYYLGYHFYSGSSVENLTFGEKWTIGACIGATKDQRLTVELAGGRNVDTDFAFGDPPVTIAVGLMVKR